MDQSKSEKYSPISNTDNLHQKLENYIFPEISLPNQNGNLLKLNRDDTFRLVIYFYSLTGHPNKRLPKNWEQIPGAQGCTLENSNFRDNYEKFIELIWYSFTPLGVTTSITSFKLLLIIALPRGAETEIRFFSMSASSAPTIL